MKLIVGLGNPGIEYQFTPHNLGFLVVDQIAQRCAVRVSNRHCRSLTAKASVAGEPVLLAKPETYMNLSGLAVRELVEEYEIEPAKDLIVIHDELDFPLGTMRIRQRGSSAGHNGMESVIGAMGTQEFLRIRLGVAPDHAVRDGARYVTTPFRKPQYAQVEDVLERAADAVEVIVAEGPAKAMNRFNQRPQAEGDVAAEK